MKNLLEQLERQTLELVKSIGQMAEDLDCKAYLVGGPVRDLILKKSNIDLDIVVEGSAMRLADRLASQHNVKPKHYPAFKTATVRLAHDMVVDFATAREESYARPGAFPTVKPSTVKKDLFRRDFTINAMAIAINPKSWGKLVDPHKGKEDLKAKKIRILHGQSFVDDPTRILRAARFKARFDFSLEAKTLKSLKSAIAMKVLDTIKPQRYLKDLQKILKELKGHEAIKCLKEWKAYKGE